MSQLPLTTVTMNPIRLLGIMRQWVLVVVVLMVDQQQLASAHFQSNGESGLSPNDQPSSKIFCQFNKKEYSPGDVWFPPAPIRSSMSICIRCICLNTGRLNCTQEACPSNCNESNDPCCKTCSVIPNPTVSRDRATIPQVILPPVQGSKVVTGTEDEEDEEEDDNVSCLHQGKVYRDREVFTANVSGLPIAAIDQCMQCQCQTGMVLCAMKACSTFKCSLADLAGSKGHGDSCCQRCAVWKSNGIGSGGGGSSLNLQSSGDEIIQSRVLSNHVIKDASQQQERIGGLGGSMASSESLLPRYAGNRQQVQENQAQGMLTTPAKGHVTSLDSTVTFRDTKSVLLPNGKPAQKPSDDCISSGIFYLHGSTWHPTIGPFGPMECVSCKCQHGQIDCDRLKCPGKRELPCGKPVKVEGHCCPICTSPSDKIFEGTAFCVSAKQDTTAFKSFGFGQNDTEYIEFAFLRPRRLTGSSDAQVERHEWKLLGVDIEEFTTQYLTLSQFESLRNRQSFTLLGATNEKNVEKFTRREKKLEKRCSSRCNVRISSLERSLRLHKLISRTQCLGHERMVHTV